MTEQTTDTKTETPKRATGFALLTKEQHRALSSKGGKAAQGKGNRFNTETARAASRIAHERGAVHKWSREEARAAGMKGGRTTASKAVASRREPESAPGDGR